MEKIRLGKTEMMVTKLGFGGLPIQRVSEEEAVAVVRRCLDLGINFIDTSVGYTTSEERIGKAISGRWEGLILATKTHARTRDELKSQLKLSLERLGVDYIDLYQFHDINDLDSLRRLLAPDGPMAEVQEAMRVGLIRHVGISSHVMDVAKEAVKSDRFETIMFALNFITNEAGSELLPLAREHDVGFIAMKPLAGGMLENITIAFKYLFQFPDVVPLVGIEKVHEIEEIVQLLAGPQAMTEAELAEMQRIREELGTRFCRHCQYCQPCPQGVLISHVFYIRSFVKRMPPELIFTSEMIDEVIAKVDDCIQCGECEEKCPYGLPISEMLQEEASWYQAEKKKFQEQIKRGVK